jgi:hypothetical protein
MSDDAPDRTLLQSDADDGVCAPIRAIRGYLSSDSGIASLVKARHFGHVARSKQHICRP